MRHRLIVFLLLLTGLAITACSPVQLLNTITPSGSYSLAKDIPYGEHDRLKLDVYKPDTPNAGAPVLIYVHGGSWSDGNKNLYKFLGENLAANGYEVVIPNYRLFPGIKFPDPVTDTAQMAAWTARQYPNRKIVLMGHSAGGYNVLMAGLVPKYLEEAGVDRCGRIAGIISLAGPTGIIPLKEEPYITIFPDRFTGKDAPLNNTGDPAPPLFLLHGADDTTVYPQNQKKLAKLVNERGGKAEIIVYPKVDHTKIIQVLSRYFDGDAPVKNDVLRFLGEIDVNLDNYCQ